MKITNEIEMQVQQVQCKYQLLMYCAFIKKKKSKTPGPSRSFTFWLVSATFCSH